MSKIAAALLFSTIVVISSGSGAQASPRAPLSTKEIKQSVSSGKKTIIFFLNPYGNPCRKQNEILTALQNDRKNKFNIAYVSATEQESRQAFYDYGVRGLPTVVLVDSEGTISKVFPPGIQSYETLASALDGAK